MQGLSLTDKIQSSRSSGRTYAGWSGSTISTVPIIPKSAAHSTVVPTHHGLSNMSHISSMVEMSQPDDAIPSRHSSPVSPVPQASQVFHPAVHPHDNGYQTFSSNVSSSVSSSVSSGEIREVMIQLNTLNNKCDALDKKLDRLEGLLMSMTINRGDTANVASTSTSTTSIVPITPMTPPNQHPFSSGLEHVAYHAQPPHPQPIQFAPIITGTEQINGMTPVSHPIPNGGSIPPLPSITGALHQ